MSPILRIIEFADEILSGKANARGNLRVCAAYLVCAAAGCWLYSHSDRDFSFVATAGSCLQTVAFFMLLHQVRDRRTVSGISSKTLQVYLLSMLFRLSSTLVKNGYLPVDRTGDWAYQGGDISSLLLVFQLLFFVHKRYSDTYQAHLDSMPIWRVVPVAVLLAVVCHGDLNHSLPFDVAWTAGMNLDTVAMLPQLWMLVARKGGTEALTANFVALMFLSRLCLFYFWYSGYAELAPKNGGTNVVGTLIVGNHALQLLFSADFMYHYSSRQAQRHGEDCNGQTKTLTMMRPVGNVM